MPHALATLTLVLLGSFSASSGGWRTSFGLASAEGRSSNRMLMLDFRADWCGPCKLMDTQVYTPGFLSAQADRLIPVRIDVEKQGEIAQRYNVQALPTVIFTDSWGGELMRHSGTLNAQTMGSLIAELPSDVSGFNGLEEALARNRNDAAALAGIAEKLSSAGLFTASNAYYARALQHRPSSREDVLNGLASNNLQLRQTDQASRWLARCLREFPDSPRASQWSDTLRKLRGSRSEGQAALKYGNQ